MWDEIEAGRRGDNTGRVGEEQNEMRALTKLSSPGNGLVLDPEMRIRPGCRLPQKRAV